MLKITSFYFGSIVVNDRKFETDIILTWKGEVIPRERKHEVTEIEFNKMTSLKPEIIVIGTGTAGEMKVPDKFHLEAKIRGIELIEKLTPEAVEEFNKNAEKRVVGLFHLTC